MTSPGQNESIDEKLERLRRAAKAAITQTPSNQASAKSAPAAAARPPQAAPATRPAQSATTTRPDKPKPAKTPKTPKTPKTQPADVKAFDATSMGGALLIMVILAGVLWLIEVLNAASGHSFDRFGLQPRTVGGLWGIVTTPFIHHSAGQLVALMIPFIGLGWVVLLAGVREWLYVTGIVIVGSGVLTWLFGDGLTLGCSGLVFGWFGYILARAWFARSIKAIASAALILVFFSSLFAGLIPVLSSATSWQAHLFGFAAGIGAGWLLHPRGKRAERFKARSAGSVS